MSMAGTFTGGEKMEFLAEYQGRRGNIVIMQDRDTGARGYYEAGVFQSHATPDGTSLFAYVHLMESLLRPAENILLLGCAAGSLATMLCRQGKRVTLVDDNPVSFFIARQFFGLPEAVTCVVEDFQDFLIEEQTSFDAIGIDIGGPNFRYDEVLDPYACRAIRSRLAPGGRIAMNLVVPDHMAAFPDRILAMLTADDLSGWTYDEPGEPNRNVILSAVPDKRSCLHPSGGTIPAQMHMVQWEIRRQRLHLEALPSAQRIIAMPRRKVTT
jgi:SAM-dependent methyltransferase